METTSEGTVAGDKATSTEDARGFLEHEVVYIREDPVARTCYEVVSLREDADDQGKTFRLQYHKDVEVPKGVLDKLLIVDIPDYLRISARRKVHVVVSTGSGTGMAVDFYQSALQPLLERLGFVSADREKDANEKSYALTITQDAHSIRRFARDLSVSAKTSEMEELQHTIVLLSGDGGTIELLNGKAPGDEDGTLDKSLPLIATLPLGTGNALFHSLHRPLYAASEATVGPSPLVLGLRTLLRGEPKPLPSFKAEFSAGSRTIAYSKPEDGATLDADSGTKEESSAVSHLYGAIVASYGLHSQLVWESDTPEYRRYGSKRFGLVAAELMKENHVYNATVGLTLGDGSTQRQLDREQHAYVLSTLVSNLEKTFTISPASQPLDGQLRLVHFGPVPAAKTMEIMMQAYNNGNHIGMEWEGQDGTPEKVAYDPVKQVKITMLEEDPRWRKVCVDGTIVEIPKGGSMTVTTETRHHLQVVAPRAQH